MTKRILITGAGSGFGKAAAIGMAKNGHAIIATDPGILAGHPIA